MRRGRVGALLLGMLPLLAPAPAEGSSPTRVPRGARAPSSGAAARHDPVLRLGGAQLDLEALRAAALEELKARMAEAAAARAEELRGAFEGQAQGLGQQLYADFLHWLNERVRDRLLRQYPHLAGQAALDEKYAEWLESPDQELSHYVDLYLQERTPAVKWLLDAYRDEASWEIAGGVQQVFDDAHDKLRRFTGVVADAEREPNAPTAELLRRHGLSGEWVDSFEAHEHRFRTFDEGYRVVEATRLLAGAFQTRVPREKLDRLTELMSLLGGVAEDSHIPVAALFGQIVKAYGDVAREMLGQLDRLSKQLRQRAGHCVGAGATGDDRQRAFVRQIGSREQACPTRLKDVYERTLPPDGRIYFYVDGRFRAGREGNGEFPAVLAARSLIHAAVAQGDATWQGRESDLGVLADVYDVAYSSPRFGQGLAGLLREAEETMAGIARRQRELEAGLAGCGRDALRRALERETGLRAGESFEPVAGNEQRLAVRFAVGFIRGGGAHATYSRIWAALRELSLLRVEGRVVEPGGGACPACAGAALQVYPTGLQELEGCRVTQADQEGRFVLHALARSADFRLGLSASNHGRRTAAVELTRAVVGVERVPFVAAFAGVRLELPAAGVAAARPPHPGEPASVPSSSDPAGPGVDTSVGRGPGGPVPGAGAVSPPAAVLPQVLAPEPGRIVPELVGLPVDVASQRVASAGLVAHLVGGDPAPRADLAFRVQAQEPAAGSPAQPGARVTLEVHAAFDPRRTVPAVVGLALPEAERRLRAAGFAPELAGGDPAPSPEHEFRVQEQRPAGGEPGAAGSPVRLRVHSRFDPRRAVPAVVGLAAAEAERRLRAAGFVPELAGGDPAPSADKAFLVQSQEPAAQAPLPAGRRVRVRVHSAFVAPTRLPTQPSQTTAAALPSPAPFRCPSFGGQGEAAPRAARTCWYGHDGGMLILWAGWEDGSRGSGGMGCGRMPESAFKPFDGSNCGHSSQAPCRFYSNGPSLSATFHSASRRAKLTLTWERRVATPLPPELEDLARRALAEAERLAAPCGAETGQPAPTPLPSPPASRPAVAPPQPPPDGRLPCTCRDAAGKPYRMSLDQECDPASWLRTDDCRP